MKFSDMMKFAQDALREVPAGEYTQAVVCLSAKGNVYTVVIQNALDEKHIQEAAFIEQLKDKDDTVIKSILCLWQTGELDLPGYAFREMLRNLNANNMNAEIYVLGRDRIFSRTVAEAMPPS